MVVSSSIMPQVIHDTAKAPLLEAKTSEPSESNPSASLSLPRASAAINLVGSTIGAGVVSLPFAFQQASIVPTLIVLSVVGVLTLLSVYLTVCCGLAFHTKTFGAFSECFGKKARLAMEALTAFVLCGVILSLQIIILDSVKDILPEDFDVPPAVVGGAIILLIVFPLSLLRNFDFLKFSRYLSH